MNKFKHELYGLQHPDNIIKSSGSKLLRFEDSGTFPRNFFFAGSIVRSANLMLVVSLFANNGSDGSRIRIFMKERLASTKLQISSIITGVSHYPLWKLLFWCIINLLCCNLVLHALLYNIAQNTAEHSAKNMNFQNIIYNEIHVYVVCSF